MNDLYFSFPTQAAQNSAMPEGTLQNTDIIGYVVGNDGVTLNTSNWLVNVRLLPTETISTDLSGYAINPPLFPKRIWFPDNTGAVI